MNWDYWLPWRASEENGAEDSEGEGRVIEGNGPKRIIVNESENEPPYGTTD